jgi:hypothetical protein
MKQARKAFGGLLFCNLGKLNSQKTDCKKIYQNFHLGSLHKGDWFPKQRNEPLITLISQIDLGYKTQKIVKKVAIEAVCQ